MHLSAGSPARAPSLTALAEGMLIQKSINDKLLPRVNDRITLGCEEEDCNSLSSVVFIYCFHTLFVPILLLTPLFNWKKAMRQLSDSLHLLGIKLILATFPMAVG